MKTKQAGDIKRTLRVTANGLQFLNGKQCVRHARIPCILLDYNAPDDAHPFAQGERFAIWCKLEEATYRKVVQQLNPDLRELTMWFDKKELDKIVSFMKEEGGFNEVSKSSKV